MHEDFFVVLLRGSMMAVGMMMPDRSWKAGYSVHRPNATQTVALLHRASGRVRSCPAIPRPNATQTVAVCFHNHRNQRQQGVAHDAREKR